MWVTSFIASRCNSHHNHYHHYYQVTVTNRSPQKLSLSLFLLLSLSLSFSCSLSLPLSLYIYPYKPIVHRCWQVLQIAFSDRTESMNVFLGWLRLVCPCVVVHKRTLLMSLYFFSSNV